MPDRELVTHRETVILTGDDVLDVLSPALCIEAVESAFRLLGEGRVEPPAVMGIHVANGGFHVKAAALTPGDRPYFAAKTNGNFPGNPVRNGLPTIQGVLVLCDADDGRPLAVMDSISITELRTAAATAVAARYLSSPDASRAAIVGCGAQAPSQLRALMTVREITRVAAFDVDAARAASFADEMSRELGVAVDATSTLEDALGDCEVCITCTPSRSPIVQPGMLQPGAFVAAVGADNPHKVEIAPELMREAKVVVDSLEQCREIGDLRHAIEAGAMTEADVAAELGAVVAGEAPGWTAGDDLIVFDSTGMGLQDTAAASAAYERAVDEALGSRIVFAGGGRE